MTQVDSHPTKSKVQDPLSWTWAHPAAGALPARSLAALALDCTEALRKGRISAEDVWNSGLNVRTYRLLKALKADPRLLQLLEWAMELPDVQKWAPHGMTESIDAIEHLAKKVLAQPRQMVRKHIRPSKRPTAKRISSRRPSGIENARRRKDNA
jgi:hypothetical protein